MEKGILLQRLPLSMSRLVIDIIISSNMTCTYYNRIKVINSTRLSDGQSHFVEIPSGRHIYSWFNCKAKFEISQVS